MFTEFFKLFKRPKTVPARPEPIAPATVVASQKEDFADSFQEEFESSFLVVEGKGDDSEWAAWVEAEESSDFAYAPTSPTPLGLK